VKTVQLTKARGQLAGAMPVSEGMQVMLISNGGTVIRMPVDEIKRLGRSTQGVIVMRLRGDEQVSSIALVAESEEPIENGETVPERAGGSVEDPTGENGNL
jgi:DNA gyrase subunit A